MKKKQLVVNVQVTEEIDCGSDLLKVRINEDACVHVDGLRGRYISGLSLDQFQAVAAAVERLVQKQEAVRRAIEDA